MCAYDAHSGSHAMIVVLYIHVYIYSSLLELLSSFGKGSCTTINEGTKVHNPRCYVHVCAYIHTLYMYIHCHGFVCSTCTVYAVHTCTWTNVCGGSIIISKAYNSSSLLPIYYTERYRR